MKVFKWVLIFLLWWVIATAVSIAIELGMAALGFPLSSAGSGLIIAIIITFGLILYGTRKQK